MIQGPQCSVCGNAIEFDMAEFNDGQCQVCRVNRIEPPNDIIRQARGAAPRCLVGYERRDGTVMLTGLMPDDENVTHQLFCPCGGDTFEVLGPHLSDNDGSTCFPEVPLSTRCTACGNEHPLFDPSVDGFDAETGQQLDTSAEGDTVPLQCHSCGGGPFTVAASLEYAFDPEPPTDEVPELAERGQDFFTCIDLFAGCTGCGELIHLVRHHSLQYGHEAGGTEHEITPERYVEDAERAMEVREAHYEKWFGSMIDQVHHTLVDVAPVHIDIYQFPPSGTRDWWTLVTGGMSDLKQVVPEGVEGVSGRTELMMYVREPKDWMFSVLRGLATMPFEEKTWLHWHHTVPNGMPMTEEPSQLTSYFFLPPYFEPDEFDSLELDGDRVDFLLLVPITESERHFAMQHGSEALEDEMAEIQLDPVVDESRGSIV